MLKLFQVTNFHVPFEHSFIKMRMQIQQIKTLGNKHTKVRLVFRLDRDLGSSHPDGILEGLKDLAILPMPQGRVDGTFVGCVCHMLHVFGY